MYVAPIAANPPSDEDRQPIWQVTSGDSWVVTTRLQLVTGEPVTPETAHIRFVLSENRFKEEPYWTGTWHDGIEEVDRHDHPGLVRITIPNSVGDTLRRGVYFFSIAVADRLDKNASTPVRGSLVVEYEPTSPQHNIPYQPTPPESDE